MFQAQGHALHINWLSRRLQAHAVLQPAGAAMPDWLPAQWQGFASTACWLDLGDDNTSALLQRQQHCQQQGLAMAEICGQWQPQGEQFGFMLLCGTELPVADPIHSWLDCCAPAPAAWLHCGPVGSARYTRNVINTMEHACLLTLKQLSMHVSPTAIHWEQILSEQTVLADKLYQLSRRYLQQCNISPDGWSSQQAASNFALPPAQQSHFAANLAMLIVLAMQQRDAMQQLLQLAFERWHKPA